MNNKDQDAIVKLLMETIYEPMRDDSGGDHGQQRKLTPEEIAKYEQQDKQLEEYKQKIFNHPHYRPIERLFGILLGRRKPGYFSEYTDVFKVLNYINKIRSMDDKMFIGNMIHMMDEYDFNTPDFD